MSMMTLLLVWTALKFLMFMNAYFLEKLNLCLKFLNLSHPLTLTICFHLDP